MNERIRALAEQARAEVRADWAKGNKIPYPEAHYAFQRDNDQKFAELIVRECMDIARNVGNISEPDDWALDRCYEIEQKVKDHFGVEE